MSKVTTFRQERSSFLKTDFSTSFANDVLTPADFSYRMIFWAHQVYFGGKIKLKEKTAIEQFESFKKALEHIQNK